jgi:hypothetical protein
MDKEKPQGRGPMRLDAAEVREGLRLERGIGRAHDLLHVAENEQVRFIEQLRVLYGVPDSWVLRNWSRGFEPPEGGS